jgi:hypothetical protein
MANVNPGPAVTSNAAQTAVYAPATTPNFGNIGQGSNALRCLAQARAVSIAAGTGDIAVIPLINTQIFVVTAIIFSNAYSITNGVVTSATAAALTVSVNGGPGVTGTSLVASAALTNLTGSTKYVSSTVAEAANTLVLASTMGTSGAPSNYIYVNSTVISGAAQYCDFFVFGYDLT